VLALAALALGGCASPNIILEAQLPSGAPPAAGKGALAVEAVAAEAPGSKYEEKSDKTLIGNSESLGVHLSDIWLQDTRAAFVKRLVTASLEGWGYRVSSAPGQPKVQVRANKVAMESKAINMFQFQADGAIDADLDVSRPDGSTLYRGHYKSECTQTTATETPSKEYLQKIFDRCVSGFQAQLDADAALREALSRLASGAR